MSTPTPIPFEQQEIFEGDRLGPGDEISLGPRGEILGFTIGSTGNHYSLAPDGKYRLDTGIAPAIERIVTEGETLERCSICLTAIELGETVAVLPCTGHAGHGFHKECINGWFRQSGYMNCPFRCVLRPKA